jgi:hypothetical protein
MCVRGRKQPGDPLTPAGGLGIFLPHGLKFAQPVTLTLKYDPAKVPSGKDICFRPLYVQASEYPAFSPLPRPVWISV